MKKETLHTTDTFECPFCGLDFDVVEDDAGEPSVVHPMPICSVFRKEAERRAGVS